MARAAPALPLPWGTGHLVLGPYGPAQRAGGAGPTASPWLQPRCRTWQRLPCAHPSPGTVLQLSRVAGMYEYSHMGTAECAQARTRHAVTCRLLRRARRRCASTRRLGARWHSTLPNSSVALALGAKRGHGSWHPRCSTGPGQSTLSPLLNRSSYRAPRMPASAASRQPRDTGPAPSDAFALVVRVFADRVADTPHVGRFPAPPASLPRRGFLRPLHLSTPCNWALP